ncbi:putative DMT superfamily transporter inner membrane protein [Phocoenobacter uteri]|uniref:Putative DMT superfamily transporter inner membrane protein n=2 Tax=Pasteurellales TaxID=135625 RepID=A0A379CCI1_9PAST|nr:DMT family transporter [Phocoenobacter uteri]MDG6881752.1 permease [Phocoenobacter uteri]SUB59789.1 putative DMT superfamily transporter inner membrane protein [Phocoenobacter uteri]
MVGFKKHYFLFIVLALAMIRGSSYLFIKDVITVYSPFEIVFFRFFLTGIVLFIFYRKLLAKATKYDVIFGVLAGLFLFSAFAFQTYGLKYTTVSKQSFLTSLYIVLIPLLNFVFFKEKLQKAVVAVFSLILIGLFFISFDNVVNLELSFNYGDFLTLLCAFGFALNIILISKIAKFEIHIMNITTIQMLSTGLFAFIFQLIFEKEMISLQSMNFSLIYLILICTMLNFTLQNISQKYVPAHIMGLILSTEAIFGTIFAVIFLEEKLNTNFIIGTILITAGVVLVQFFENKKEKQSLN